MTVQIALRPKPQGCHDSKHAALAKPTRKRSFRSKLCKYRRSKTTTKSSRQVRRAVKQDCTKPSAPTTSGSLSPSRPSCPSFQNNLLICGYFRRHNRESKLYVPRDIVDTVFKFLLLDSMSRYVQSVCTAEPPSGMGRVAGNRINMAYFVDRTPELTMHCKHCEGTRLTFQRSHRELPERVGFKNNANQFRCDSCLYYTVLNVRVNVVQHKVFPTRSLHDKYRSTMQDTIIFYASPLRALDWSARNSNKRVQSHMMDETRIGEPAYCPVCYTADSVSGVDSFEEETGCIEMFQVFKRKTKVKHNIFYCKLCDFYLHKVLETTCTMHVAQ